MDGGLCCNGIFAVIKKYCKKKKKIEFLGSLKIIGFWRKTKMKMGR